MEHARAEKNMLLAPNVSRGSWADGLGLKNLAEERADVAFFAGCRAAFDPDASRTARSTVMVLKKAGMDVGILGDGETCCGARAFSLGYRADFQQLAARTAGALGNAGARLVVTACAECYWAFKRLYPEHLGQTLPVVHSVELIDELIAEGDIRPTRSVAKKVTYHDPCHLGRLGEPYVPWDGVQTKVFGKITKNVPPKPRYNGVNGVFDAPRRVLSSIPGVEFVEMERIREYAWCCGAGGGVREAFPEFSAWTAAERISEAKATGAQTLVTACPGCERNFHDAAGTSGDGIEVLDLAELVLQAIE